MLNALFSRRVFALGFASLLSALSNHALAATYTVTVTTDGTDETPGDGMCATAAMECSLRAAIVEANADPGADTIAFNIPGAGVHRISPASALPFLTEPVTIDGYTQPGAAANTQAWPEASDAVLLIELDGSGAAPETSDGNAALRLNGGLSTVRGLAIFGWTGTNNGRIWIGSDDNVVEGNYLGLLASGTAGGDAFQDNTTSGNGYGIRVDSGTDNRIGGTGPAERNVFVNNWRASIWMRPGTTGVVEGNIVGLDKTGLAVPLTSDAMTPRSTGIWLEGAAVTVGGAVPGARNVICTSFSPGVTVDDSDGVDVRGNYIGWMADGSTECGEGGNGASVLAGSDGALVRGNLIRQKSASFGVLLFGSSGATVSGNIIGIDVTGTTATTASGAGTAAITIRGATDSLITGNTIAVKNIGIYFYPFPHSGTRVESNFIGTDATRVPTFSNGASFYIDSGTATVGGPGKGNVIKGGQAVLYSSATGVAFLENEVWEGPSPAYDLGANGATANDALDADTGANNLQNYPVLTGVRSVDGVTFVEGQLSSLADQSFRIEFFSNGTSAGGTYGPLENFVGSTNVTTDASGVATFDVELPAATTIGHGFSSTATLCTDATCTAWIETSEPGPRIASTGCTSDADCSTASPTEPRCDVIPGQCEECVSDNHCGDGNGCTTDTCVDNECDNASLAAGDPCSTGVCDGEAVDPECVNCLEDEDCDVGAPNCDTDTNLCQGCVTDGDCDDSNECTIDACDATTCIYDAVAEGVACAGGVCDGASNGAVCVECVETDDCTGADPVCDTDNDICVECLANEDCGGETPACDTATNVCVGCLSDADCDGADECSDGNVCTTPAPDASVEDDAGDDGAAGDASVTPDAAINPTKGGLSGGGCGCSTASPKEPYGLRLLALSLVALAATRRRKR